MRTDSFRRILAVSLALALVAGCEGRQGGGAGSTTTSEVLDQALVLTPASPSDLVVLAINGSQANASWTDNSLDETEFRLQRADDEEFTRAPMEWILPPDTTQASDFTIRPNRTYFYRVLAVNANGASAPSPAVRIFTPPSQPTVSVVTPAGSPALFQSGTLEKVEAQANPVGEDIAYAEFQLLFDDAPGTFIAQEVMSQPDDTAYAIPEPLATIRIDDATPIPPLPPSAIVELQIYGRVAQAGGAGNGYEWRIGGTEAEPTFIIYESASTRHPRPRRPGVGDAVWITALRTQAPGPLVATRITFRAPDPQPVAAATFRLSALYKGTIESYEEELSAPGVSYGGQTVLVHNADDNLTVPFRIDYPTFPGFPAFVDDGLLAGNAVEVRFWVAPPAELLPVARQVFPQVQAASQPPVNPDTVVINDDPVPFGLPKGTFLQFMINGVITGVSSDLMTWQIGDPADPVVVYGHAATLPISDIFRTVPAIGDFVIVTARRSLEPGPLIADQILILFDGPAPSFAIMETSIQVVYLFNGTVTDVGAANGGARWTVSAGGYSQEFVMNDPHDPAVIDPGPLPSLGLGSLVTVEFIPPTQVLPADNWAMLSYDTATGRWSSDIALPAVDPGRQGTFFVRTTDVAGQTATAAVPAELLAGVANQAPTAVDDGYLAAGTETLTVAAPGVLGNDLDPEASPLTAELVTPPSGTSAFTLNADGSFSFTYGSNPAVPTPVTFTYRASDGLDVSNVATVTVTVQPQAVAPVAVDDSGYVATGTTPLVVAAPGVLGNDSDANGDPLTAVLVTPPSGTSAFALNADGSFSFTYGSNPMVPTPVTFTYRASDGVNLSNLATVTVTVQPQAVAPVAVDDSGYLASGTTTLQVAAPGVLGNDSDANGDPLTAVLVGPPAGTSAFTLNADGSFSFTYGSNPMVPTPVTFTYRASDGVHLSNLATVTVIVEPQPVAPVAVDDSGYVATGTTTLVVAAPGVLGNDSDANGDPLSAVLVTPPAGTSAFTLNADGSFSFTYGSNPAVPTPVTFTYRASDGVNQSNLATVTVTVQPQAGLPAAPSNLTASVISGPRVRCTAIDNATNETGFVVERAVGSGAFALLVNLPSWPGTGSASYTDSTVTAGNTYHYRVKTVNAAGSSAWSNTATVTVPSGAPAAPSNLSLSAVVSGSTDTVTATWTDNSSDETAFTIQVSTSPTFSSYSTFTAGANATSLSQSGIARGLTLYARMRASNSLGSSAWTPTTTFVTP